MREKEGVRVMGHQVPARAGEVEFLVEVSGPGGMQTVSDNGSVLDFDGVRDTVQAIADQLAGVWEKVAPAEATVQFGLNVVAKPGKLTGLLVEGSGEASLQVTLVWRR